MAGDPRFGAPPRFPTVNGGGRSGFGGGRNNFGGPNRPPTNLLQAYGNMGGKLPGMQYARLPTGFNSPGEWGYDGSHPVNLAQAYQNMGGKLPIPPAGQAGAPGAGSGSGAGASPGIDPRDATYYQNVSENEFKSNNQLNALNLQKSQAGTALQSALGNLRYQEPRDQLAMEQRANQAGALYSSPYAQNQGNLAHRYATQENTLETNYANLVDRLSAQQSAIQQGVPLYESGQYLGAAERGAKAAAADPATGQPPAVPVPGANAAQPPAAPAAPGGVPAGYSNPAQQIAASQAAAKRGGAGTAPKGMPAAGRILNFNGQHYRVSYDAAGQARFTRVGGGR